MAWKARERDAYERDVSLLYAQVSMWIESHTNKGYKMKPLKQYLPRDRRWNTGEQLALLQQWADRLGTPLVTEAV